MTVMNTQICPLCGNDHCKQRDQNHHRPFFECDHCALVFVPTEFHLSPDEEKAIYDYHENDPADAGYRNFLQRLTIPLIDRLPKGARGIDVGCGPGPALAAIMIEAGFSCSNYDPFFAPNKQLLKAHYDFVTATEVVEHFCHPADGFAQLFSLVKPGGVLGLMTKTIPELQRFSDWHYTRDLTHVSFYAPRTLGYIANQYHCELEILRSDVAILTRR